MGRTVRKLSNLEIDEVSLVDRPANQHGLVAIAKSYQEDNMAVFDANGDEVFEEELSSGDLVYDEQGNEYVFSEGGDDTASTDYDDDGEEVGKSAASTLRDLHRVPSALARGRAASGAVHSRRELRAAQTGRKARRAVNDLRDAGRDYANGNLKPRAARAGATARNVGQNPGVYARRGGNASVQHLSANRAAYIAGGGGFAGGSATGAYVDHRRGVHKSLGEEVLQELSKALTEDDRDQVIAKALDAVSDIAKRNEDLEETVAAMLEAQELQGFGQVAKSYGPLPVDDDELGGLLHRASQFLPEEDLDILDRVLSSAGDISKSYFDEVGSPAYGEGSTLEEVYAVAGNAVLKGDMGLSEEAAITAVFDNNPAAYDAYEAETRMR